MISQLLSTSPSQAHYWSSLDKLIYKICSLYRPSFRDLTLFDYCLLGQDLFSNSSAISADIRSPTHHQLEDDDSKCIVIDLIAVILFSHNLGSHVSRCSTCISAVFLPKILCNSQISKMQVPIRIKHQIFRFDIPMNNLLRMHIF